MIGRLAAGLRALRPREITQIRKSVTDVRTDVQKLHDSIKTLTATVASLEQAISRQRLDLAALGVRESQLRAIAKRDILKQDRLAEIDRILDTCAVDAHVRQAFACTPLHEHPFPYMVVDNLLPDAVYDLLIEGLPPYELFADRPANKQQMPVPFHLAPADSRRIWQFMAEHIGRRAIMPAAIEKFRGPIRSWLRTNFGVEDTSPEDLGLVCSDGRIMLRTRGYRITPHRDPKWSLITCLMYLARPGDDERWGTQLYEVENDQEAQGAAPLWIDEEQCRLVENVAFRRNRLLVFVNSVGAHGAFIPDDAEPRDLERYIYQFRIAPRDRTIKSLMGRLPPERVAYWEGKRGY